MMLRGVKIDLAKKATLSKEFSYRAEECRRRISEEVGDDYNPSSSAQMQVLFYASRVDGGLGLQPQYSPKTGRPSIDQDALLKLKKKHPQVKVINYLLEYRKFSKLASTYAEMVVDSDGRIHTSYGFVSTWRLSSSESPFGGGGNLQNIPVRSTEGKLIRALLSQTKIKSSSPQIYPKLKLVS